MALIKRIIFFVESPFSKFYYDILGMETLQRNGFEVEVWNFTPFLHPQVNKEAKISDFFEWKNHYSFSTFEEARASIHKLGNNCFVICLISYNINSILIYRSLSIVNLPYCVHMANALPSVNKREKWDAILKNLKKLTLVKILNAIFNYIPYYCLGIKPATFILAGGKESTYYKYPIDKKTEILWLHTTDYDIYLENRDTPVQYDINMGVFLDEYLPFHPDFVQLGLSVPTTPEEYYPGICKFFDYIEQEYGIHIVIAAHPKSNYEKYPDYFGGRSIIKGKTAELVRKSRFAIAHMSTSINFAVLFHKPIIFLTSNRLKQSYIGPQIDLMAYSLGKKAIDIDYPIAIDWKKELSINEKTYMNYRQSYIKREGSEELPFWQIFANRINNYNE